MAVHRGDLWDVLTESSTSNPGGRVGALLAGLGRHLQQITLAALISLLVACGGGGIGGGGGGGGTNNPPPPPPPSGISIDLGAAPAVSTAACVDSPLTAQSVMLSKLAGTVPANTLRIHYQRTGADYPGWGLHVWNDTGSAANTTGIDWSSPLQAAGTDSFGQYYDIPLTATTGRIGYIFHKGDDKDHGGADQGYTLAGNFEIWRKQADLTTYESAPVIDNTPDAEFVRVHYKRYASDFSGYGLHIWEFANGNDIDIARLPSGVQIGDWPNPVPFGAPMTSGNDSFGVYIDVPVKKYSDGARGFNFLVHKGSDDSGKDGGDRNISFSSGYEIWLVEGDNSVYYSKPLGDISLSNAKAFWLDATTLVWPRISSDGSFKLYYKVDGGMTVGAAVSNSTGVLNLTVGSTSDVTATAAARIPYVPTPQLVLKLPADLDTANLKKLLRTQLLLVHQSSSGEVLDATTPQLPGVLDTLYAAAAKPALLGVTVSGNTPSFKVWAPTARGVAVCIYDNGNSGSASTVHTMTLDNATGVWSYSGSASQVGKYYRYVVDVFVRSTGALERNLVTDPYSLSLSANSQRSWVGSLSSADSKPAGWEAQTIPALAAPEDLSIYEVHVRDFSVADSSVSSDNRGKFLAFTETNSDGMQHLQSLRQAGLTMVHLLPVNDMASVSETGCTTPVVAVDAPDAESQQATVYAARDTDCFNWGYDPLHYTALEGSYASNAGDGVVRVKEFRQAVLALHQAGLRVALDVVYNHTPASGQNSKSVLDRIVPGYYHRLDIAGNVTNSTCCDNTATEHDMMAKLMIDSVSTLATAYAIDAFRFDIMGHLPKAAMQELQTAVNTAAGRPIYLYGEGWNFGEVADNARFVQATQRNLAGTGIGSFNDRIRDMLRGGGAFDGGDSLIRNQGLVNGLYVTDNGSGGNKTLADLLWVKDIAQLGIAATLTDYSFVASNDQSKTGEQIDYYGQGAGYTADPQETINYADKHDNQTLYDINGYKLPLATSMADRVRAQNLGYALITLAQGIPFYHAGMDVLRSKSYDRDSYNSGDHFNAIDWSLLSNNYGVGAPIADKNQDNWSLIKPRLANAALKPDVNAATRANEGFREWLQIRKSTTLFRLRTGADVKARLAMLNTGSTQVPGLIAWQIDGNQYNGAVYKRVVVIANIDDSAQVLTVASLAGVTLGLHPVQASGSDAVVKSSSFNGVSGEFTVPARTVAVFVEQ